MPKALWFAAGIVAGAAAAHVVFRTPQGRAIAEQIDDRVAGFTAALVDGYRIREAELRSAADRDL